MEKIELYDKALSMNIVIILKDFYNKFDDFFFIETCTLFSSNKIFGTKFFSFTIDIDKDYKYSTMFELQAYGSVSFFSFVLSKHSNFHQLNNKIKAFLKHLDDYKKFP